jgi:DNA-binding transcriptional MerR regulator
MDSKAAVGPDRKRHPIAVAARRTGLSKDVLRVWESRHGVVTPERTDTGRRLYSDGDVERLALLRQATTGGWSIGQIADLSIQDLQTLVEEDRLAAVAEAAEVSTTPGASSRADSYVTESLAAVDEQDSARLRNLLDRAAFELPVAAFTQEVVSPVLRRIGDLWHDRQLDSGQEHVASAVIRAALANVLASIRPADSAPRMVVTSPAGDVHELGAMLAAIASAAEGWQVTYLGADLPAAAIASTVRRRGARVVALSLIYPENDPGIANQLYNLRELLDEDVGILVGGAAAASYDAVVEAIGAERIDRMGELGDALLRVGRQ